VSRTAIGHLVYFVAVLAAATVINLLLLLALEST
jgi:hypothetical protein